MIRSLPLFAVVCFWLASGCICLAAEAEQSLPGEPITQAEIKTHLETLADDTFEGRESGTRGGNAAAGYIVQQLRNMRIAPAGEGGSYFQAFGLGYRNILAQIEGGDPVLKHEVIVVGAHYDHVGYGSQRNSYGPWGYIHNGADDNASGTAGLLELMQALNAQPLRSPRTVLFAFWDAEEKGLLGSKHWVDSPTIAFSRVKCFVNADMIGRLRNERVEIYGSRSAAGFRQLVGAANRDIGLDLDFTWTMKDDSDHWSFFQRQIPTLMFHTGLHGEYHRPADDTHLINYSGTERVAKLMLASVQRLAAEPVAPLFRSQAKRETNEVRLATERASIPPPPRLGLTWKKQPSPAGGSLLVMNLTHFSPAQRAGIVPGDTITHCQGEPIDDDEAFRRRVLLSTEPLELRIQRANQAPRDVRVPLDGKPIRVGLSWRQDEAEPNVVIVSYVVYGSAAHQAGLRIGDRVESVDHQTFHTTEEFRALIDQPVESLSLRGERNGRAFEVNLAMSDL